MNSSDVASWVESISNAAFDSHRSGTSRKRHRSPSPYRMSTSGHLPSPDTDQSASPRTHSPKRRRTRDPDGQTQITPRPRRPASALDGADELNLSEPGSSSVSGLSTRSLSPSKQLWNAVVQPTGFYTAKLNGHDQPPTLQRLVEDLQQISLFEGILPANLRDEFASERLIRPYHFSEDASVNQVSYPSLQHVRNILRSAEKCSQNRHGESSWNLEVHAEVLKCVLRNPSNQKPRLDFRYCVGARIIPEYHPSKAPTKMVDFCLAIEVDQDMTDTIINICRTRPELSINHTDWGDLVDHPLAISMETKTASDYRTALVQIATWHAAQWRSLRYGVVALERIEFLPGIIVCDDEWYFVATIPDKDKKATTLESLKLGSTASILEIYQLFASLNRLKLWAETVFWPAFRADILQLNDEVLVDRRIERQ